MGLKYRHADTIGRQPQLIRLMRDKTPGALPGPVPVQRQFDDDHRPEVSDKVVLS